jgi:hypothetical protein
LTSRCQSTSQRARRRPRRDVARACFAPTARWLRVGASTRRSCVLTPGVSPTGVTVIPGCDPRHAKGGPQVGSRSLSRGPNCRLCSVRGLREARLTPMHSAQPFAEPRRATGSGSTRWRSRGVPARGGRSPPPDLVLELHLVRFGAAHRVRATRLASSMRAPSAQVPRSAQCPRTLATRTRTRSGTIASP